MQGCPDKQGVAKHRQRGTEVGVIEWCWCCGERDGQPLRRPRYLRARQTEVTANTAVADGVAAQVLLAVAGRSGAVLVFPA